jgi:hypothetical protein
MSWCKGSVAQSAMPLWIFMFGQKQRAAKSSTEMAPRHHHFHVYIVDRFLDPFRRLHLSIVGSLNSIISACYGRDDTPSCLLDKLGVDIVSPRLSFWVPLFEDILFVNVSTVPAPRPLTLSKHSQKTDLSPGVYSILYLMALSSGGLGSCVLTRVGLS